MFFSTPRTMEHKEQIGKHGSMTSGMNKKLSVCLITYNHESYIEQALQSILMQKTNFEYEIIIGEDYSKDLTRSIISSYKNKHPDMIFPIFRPSNIGMKANFIDTYFSCSGEYVAVLSGDDYWIDPFKLQKQVDFLDENGDYVLVGHNSIIVDDVNTKRHCLTNSWMKSYDVSTRELMISNPFSASQVMFRNFIIREFPSVYYQSTGEDRRLYLLLSQHGKCRVDCDVTGVYRKHSNSITKSRVTKEKILANQIESMQNARNWNKYFDNRFIQEERLVISKTAYNIVINMLKQKRIFKAVRFSMLIKLEDINSEKARKVVLFLQLTGRILNVNQPII